MDINIILNDENILIVEKPFGMPVQSDKTGDKSLLEILKEKMKPNIFLIHRLDRPVGGVMVFAKNKNAGAFLSQNILKKTYLAVVCGVPKKEDTLTDYIIKNERLNLSKIVHKNTQGAKKAELKYRLIKNIDTKKYGTLSLIEVDLKTGRHHQIRLQLSATGFPIYGDTKYNSLFQRKGIYYNTGDFVYTALFSNSIKLINPTTGKEEEYKAYPTHFPFNIFNV